MKSAGRCGRIICRLWSRFAQGWRDRQGHLRWPSCLAPAVYLPPACLFLSHLSLLPTLTHAPQDLVIARFFPGMPRSFLAARQAPWARMTYAHVYRPLCHNRPPLNRHVTYRCRYSASGALIRWPGAKGARSVIEMCWHARFVRRVGLLRFQASSIVWIRIRLRDGEGGWWHGVGRPRKRLEVSKEMPA